MECVGTQLISACYSTGHRPVAMRLVRNLIFMDPCVVDDLVEIPTRCNFVIEFIISKFIEGSTCF